MAEKILRCPNCGAENPETAWFCQICNGNLGPTYVDITDQAPVRVPPRRKKPIIIVYVVAILIVSIVAATLAYYYQPVRGVGGSSLTTVCVGNPVEFYFSPHQGIAPYTYSWSFGDGGTSTGKDTFHTFHTVGTYTVTVTVTDQPGKKCSWSTTITVRLPLVFIDRVSYPSSVAESWVGYYFGGRTYYNLFVDGAQESPGIGVQPGSTHSIRVQIIGHINLNTMGGPNEEVTTTLLDATSNVTAPTTQTDLHCVLSLTYDPWLYLKFTLSPA